MMLAVTAMPGHEAVAPCGTLAVSGWRGAQTALITLSGADDEPLHASAAHAAWLLGVATHFHWAAPADVVMRLARSMRALRPHVIVAHPAVQSTVADAWAMAVDDAIPLPALRPLDAGTMRLCVADPDGLAAVDVSAARPLQIALRSRYPQSHRLPLPESPLERFTVVAGEPLSPAALPDDLFDGLAHQPLRPPPSFLRD
ncbi:MAG: hypothetical protein H6638_04135 [Ardenticatenales bacterium]|nr:hypothetical protein [Ardenticatenales bacterium]